MEIQKNKPRNTSVFGSLIAALCIIIYLAALVQGSIRIYLSIEQSRATAEYEFSQIANLALSAGTQGFMDDRFVQSMNGALAGSRTIEALIVTGPDGAQAFEKQTGHAISWVSNTPRFINRFGFSNQDFYRPLPIQNIHNANIKAVAAAFDYGEFSEILKETLLIILMGFALAFITMLLQLIVKKQPKREKVHVSAPEPVKKTPVKQQREEVTIIPEPIILEPAVREEETGPKGLYSSRSNIGWEEYTADRLDSELHRCSSTENDLTLVLLEFTNINNDADYRQSSEEAVSFFTSRDLHFEYGEYGIAIILPGMGLDASIAKSEKFYQRIIQKIPESKEDAFGLKMGLSSRSGRLINAERFMLEAKEALKRAKDDPGAVIIAFKSDPEKYRAFIASQN